MHPYHVDPKKLDEDPALQRSSDRGRRPARRAGGTGWALLVVLLVVIAVVALLLLT